MQIIFSVCEWKQSISKATRLYVQVTDFDVEHSVFLVELQSLSRVQK